MPAHVLYAVRGFGDRSSRQHQARRSRALTTALSTLCALPTRGCRTRASENPRPTLPKRGWGTLSILLRGELKQWYPNQQCILPNQTPKFRPGHSPFRACHQELWPCPAVLFQGTIQLSESCPRDARSKGFSGATLLEIECVRGRSCGHRSNRTLHNYRGNPCLEEPTLGRAAMGCRIDFICDCSRVGSACRKPGGCIPLRRRDRGGQRFPLLCSLQAVLHTNPGRKAREVVLALGGLGRQTRQRRGLLPGFVIHVAWGQQGRELAQAIRDELARGA